MVTSLKLHSMYGYAEQRGVDRINGNLDLPDLDDHSEVIGDLDFLRKHHADDGSVIKELFLVCTQYNLAGGIDTYVVFARVGLCFNAPGFNAIDFAPRYTWRSGPDKQNISLHMLWVPAAIEFKGPCGGNEHLVGIEVVLVGDGDSRLVAASHCHIDPGMIAIAIDSQRAGLLFGCPGVYYYRSRKNVGSENGEVRSFVGRVDELLGRR